MLLLKFTKEQENRLRNSPMDKYVKMGVFPGREFMDGYALDEEWFVPNNWVIVVQDDRYILEVDGVTTVEDLPTILKRIEETPDGTSWKFYPVKDTSAVTVNP